MISAYLKEQSKHSYICENSKGACLARRLLFYAQLMLTIFRQTLFTNEHKICVCVSKGNQLFHPAGVILPNVVNPNLIAALI